MKYAVLIFFSQLTFLANTQSLNKSQISAIEQSIREEMNYSSTPGLSICVINNGKVAYQNSFGIANTTTKIAVTDSTIFEIASLTKIFTSITLQTVLQKHGISINEPIGKAIKGLSPIMSSVTYGQLLSHTSGIIDAWPLKTDNIESILEYFAEAGDKGMSEKPGNVFSYSNNSFALAGLAVATLNKSAYTTAVEDYILKPLKMRNSSFNIFDVAYKSFAVGHTITNNGTATPTLMSFYKKSQPAGGLFSNIKDLSAFALALLNKGAVGNDQVLNAQIIDTLLATRKTVFSVPASSLNYLTFPEGNYGYGTMHFSYNGLHFVGHPGEAVSQNAFFFLEPNRKFAVIMLSNRGFYLFINSFKKIVDVVLGVKESNQIPVNKKDKNYQVFTGKYIVPDLNKSGKQWSEIFETAGKLFMRLEDKRVFELEPIGHAEFSFKDPDFLFPSAIAFYKDEQGKYKYLNYLFRTRIKAE